MTTTNCVGSMDPRRRSGLAPSFVAENSLLGILDVEVLRGLRPGDVHALRQSGIRTLRDLVGWDPSALMLAVPATGGRLIAARRRADAILSLKPEPEAVIALAGTTVGDVLGMDPTRLATALGSARGVLGSVIADAEVLREALADEAAASLSMVALSSGLLFCPAFDTVTLQILRFAAKLMAEAADALRNGDLELAKRLQELIDKLLEEAIRRAEKGEGGSGSGGTTPGGGSGSGGTTPGGGSGSGGTTPGGGSGSGGTTPGGGSGSGGTTPGGGSGSGGTTPGGSVPEDEPIPPVIGPDNPYFVKCIEYLYAIRQALRDKLTPEERRRKIRELRGMRDALDRSNLSQQEKDRLRRLIDETIRELQK